MYLLEMKSRRAVTDCEEDAQSLRLDPNNVVSTKRLGEQPCLRPWGADSALCTLHPTLHTAEVLRTLTTQRCLLKEHSGERW